MKKKTKNKTIHPEAIFPIQNLHAECRGNEVIHYWFPWETNITFDLCSSSSDPVRSPPASFQFSQENSNLPLLSAPLLSIWLRHIPESCDSALTCLPTSTFLSLQCLPHTSQKQPLKHQAKSWFSPHHSPASHFMERNPKSKTSLVSQPYPPSLCLFLAHPASASPAASLLPKIPGSIKPGVLCSNFSTR